MDLACVPVIDNHCHPLEPGKAMLEPLALAQEFYHGLGDRAEASAPAARGTLSAARRGDIAQLGVVHTLVAQLAALFDCEPTLAAVAAERNRRTAEGFGAYARLLYQDAGIVATVVDSALPASDPSLALIPGRILRLFQMGPAIDRCLATGEAWPALRERYLAELEHAVRAEGYVGVKSHVAEVVGLEAALGSPAEGAGALAAARAGNRAAYRRLYAALFTETLHACQRLEIPIHVHTGITGGPWDGPIGQADPFLLAPLLSRAEFRSNKIVLLHAGYPWIEHASLMAHAFPQVWVDISWVMPWASLRATDCMRALLATAPLSRLLMGTGGHGTPEVAWLGARVAKIALSAALQEAAAQGLLPASSAPRVAAMVLYDNAAALYGPAASAP